MVIKKFRLAFFVSICLAIAASNIVLAKLFRSEQMNRERSSVSSIVLGPSGTSFRHIATYGIPLNPYLADSLHLNQPEGLYIDSADNLYVVEDAGSRMLKFNSSGINTLTIGQAANFFHHDQYLFFANDVAVALDGDIWIVIDPSIKEFDANGNLKQTMAAIPWESGNTNDHFDRPRGLVFDSTGRLYVADEKNHRVQIYSFNISGGLVYSTTIGMTGVPLTDTLGFNQPNKLAMDSQDRLYVMDTGNYRVQRCTYNTNWACSTFFGEAGVNGSDLSHLGWAVGITVDSNGNVYLVDTYNYRVLKCTNLGVCNLFAGETGVSGNDNNHFLAPKDAAVDSFGNVYISDFYNHRVQKYNNDGVYLATIGINQIPYVTDNQRIYTPYGINVANDGSIYVTEELGYRLIKLNASGTQQWTIGQAGVYGDDNTHFGDWWRGLEGHPAIDTQGRIYVPDFSNHRIQIFNADGTHYSSFGSNGNGNDEFDCPSSVAINPSNQDFYIVDQCNQRIQVYNNDFIYKATLGVLDESGSDDLHFMAPRDVAIDANGNIYVADTENMRIQKCLLNGIDYSCSKLIGETGFHSNNIFGTVYPTSVAVSNSGKYLAVGEWDNHIQIFDTTGKFLTSVGGIWGGGNSKFMQPVGVDFDSSDILYIASRMGHNIQKFTLGVPGWHQVNINGFGDKLSKEVTRLSVFGDYLFASTENNTTGGEVWRSLDGYNWSQVSLDGFGSNSNNRIHVEEDFDGKFYVTLRNATSGGEIWRCTLCDGSDWEQVVSGGFGDINNAHIQSVSVYSNTLYAVVDNNITGAEVWESATGSNDHWSQMNSNGFGNPYNISAWSVKNHGGHMYVATVQVDGWTPSSTWNTEVWRTDGSNWEKVSPLNFGGGTYITWDLDTFNGYLYLVMGNLNTGADVWRCTLCDGTDWIKVGDSVFGSNVAGAGLMEFQGNLYASTTCNWHVACDGTTVWATSDGVNWNQVSIPGMGDPNNNSYKGVVFQDRLYIQTGNEANGGEIWRKDIPIFLPLVRK